MRTPLTGCWAASLGDCDGKLTGEHIVSSSILLPAVTVQGLPWCRHESRTIGAASFTCKHLCEGHNRALSPSDRAVKQFVETFREFFEKSMAYDAQPPRIWTPPHRYRLNGNEIERWFCKTLINVVALTQDVIEIPIETLLPHLYQGRPFRRPYGLSFAVATGQVVTSQDDTITIIPLLEDRVTPKALVGGLFTFRSQKLVVLLPGDVDPIRDGQLRLRDNMAHWAGLQLNWHNQLITEHKQGGQLLYQRIELSWEESSGGLLLHNQ